MLIICSRNADRAPRLYNTFHTFKDEYDVFLAGDKIPYYLDPKNFIDISFKKKLLFPRVIKFFYLLHFSSFFSIKSTDFKYLLKPSSFSVFRKIKDKQFDIIILHHIDLLPVLSYFKKKRNFKLVVNLHEYYPKEFEDQQNWSVMGDYWGGLCEYFLKNVDYFLSVNKSIGDEFIKTFNLNHQLFFTFPNVKCFENLELINNKGNIISLIHHGAAIPSRNIERMIKLMSFLPENYVLYFMLLKRNPDYYDSLKRYQSSRIKFIEPVSFNNIIKVINEFDIGLYYLNPSNFNEENSLPNKFFEFIQARLCIAISPIEEMKNILLENKLGIVSDNFSEEDLANKIMGLTRLDIFNFKKNVDKYANLSSLEFYKESLLEEFKKL